MSNTNETDPLMMLNNLKRVDAPPFLLTRIRQRIANRQEQTLNPAIVWTAGLAMLFVISINVYLITDNPGISKRGHEVNLAESMNLYPQNALYE